MYPPWIDSFELFLEYMGKMPDGKETIDRIDPEGHYVPGNVRWASRLDQARNKRYHILIRTEDGREMKTWEYAELLGVSRKQATGIADRRGLIVNSRKGYYGKRNIKADT